MRGKLDARRGGYEPWEFFARHVCSFANLAHESVKERGGHTSQRKDMCCDGWKDEKTTPLIICSCFTAS